MFRIVGDEDLQTLADIYRQSVRQLATKLYTRTQIDAWSYFPNYQAKFHEFIFKPETWLLEQEKTIIAFCGLDRDGHIVSLYVHPLFSRKGYGTTLLNFVLEKGIQAQINRFYTEASFLSQPVFSRSGFTVVEMETVKYDEFIFERYKMEKLVH